MKKIPIFSLAILSLLFSTHTTNAQEEKKSACPRTINLPTESICRGIPSKTTHTLCTGETIKKDEETNHRTLFIERFGASELRCENKRFQEEVYDKIHKDNTSDPIFTAVESIDQLRKHYQCLRDICQKTTFECTKFNLGKEKTKDQLDWCLEQTKTLLKLQKQKLTFITNTNQARKERSLIEEKFNTIRERFMNHIHTTTTQFLSQFRKFEKKVNLLIRHPKK